MIELTDEMFECHYSVYGESEPWISITSISKDSSIEIKQQILQSLKLKQRIEHRIREIQQFMILNEDPLLKETGLIDEQVGKRIIHEFQYILKDDT